MSTTTTPATLAESFAELATLARAAAQEAATNSARRSNAIAAMETAIAEWKALEAAAAALPKGSMARAIATNAADRAFRAIHA